MNTKYISQKSLEVISQYKNFSIGNAVCSVPYYNNKKAGMRGSLRAEVGKGSPKDILEEVKIIGSKSNIDLNNLSNDDLKKLLVDNNIGIDCSGFAYYVLNIDNRINFVNAKNFFRKLRSKMMPEKNVDVLALAHDKNSRLINLKEIEPGDFITMINDEERNHIIVIDKIEYENSIPKTIYYVHAIAWPTDGEYGHGIHEGKIEIIDMNKGILEQTWIEQEKVRKDNYTLVRASGSMTEIRRLNWL